MKFQKIAEKHSANCFLNSLFREWNEYTYDKENDFLVITLKNQDSLILPLKYYSLIGRHEYSNNFLLRSYETNEFHNIGFLELVKILLGHLSEKYKTTPEQVNIFIARIENSLSNIKEALELRSDEIEDLYKEMKFDFRAAEQALVVGHTFHPHPKSRDEFSEKDYKTFAPETGGEFFMNWFLVNPEILHQQVSKNYDDKNWMKTLFLSEFEITKEVSHYLDAGFIPFPVHPWQRDFILKNADIKNYLEKKWLIDLGKSSHEDKWSPTSSLRSIYRQSSPYMLKFSLSVRLTNSIRHLLPAEVVRGLQVMDVFSTKKGTELLSLVPSLNVLFEPAFLSLVDKNNKIINETIVAMRLNPFQKTTFSQKIVLATLTQDHPTGGESLIGSFIKKESEKSGESMEKVGECWFQQFLDSSVKPFLIAQSNYGIYLGAHQQNLIIEIQENMPKAAYFRDCQGTGYSQIGFQAFASEVDLMTRENGNVLDEKMGNTLFSYYLIINSTFNVITTIAKDVGLSEEHLIKKLRSNLLMWKNAGVRDSTCFDYLLNEKSLLQKGNFLCSFVDINENTSENPMGIYNLFPNPLYEKRIC